MSADQTVAEDVNGGTGDIVVTAAKRTQPLLETPIPVSVVSASTLVEQNLSSISDYYARIPGLTTAGERTSQIALRGVTTGGNTNPTIAVLVDDVPFGSSTYLGNATFPDFDPATLDRIEVLKGPQGTLYGASSLGGVIKYVTRDPNPTRLSGRVELGANTVDHGGQGVSVRGSVNVPIIYDKVALSLSGFYRRDPAYVDNLNGSVLRRDVNKRKSWGGRASMLIKPVDDLTIVLSAMKQRRDTVGTNRVSVASINDFTTVDGRVGSPTRGQPINDFTYTQSIDSGESDFELYTARATLDLGFANLTSVSAWGRLDRSDLTDQTPTFGFLASVYPGFTRAQIDDSSSLRKFSQEVRLDDTGPVIDWIIGGFYTKERAATPQSILVDSATLTSAPVVTVGGPASFREIAGFADVTWHITDTVDLEVGGRYSDNKQVNRSSTTTTPATVPFFGPSRSVTHRFSGNAFTWHVTPSIKITPDMMLYGRVAKGYRPGGTNPIIANVPGTFEPDTVINYEVGLKGTTLGRALVYDLSAFRIDWKDIQLNATSTSGLAYFLNADTARSQGLEAALQFEPITGLTLAATGTYTDAKLTSDLPRSTATSIFPFGNSGDRLPFAPKWSANFSVDKRFALSDTVSGFVGATYTYFGKRLSGLANTATAPRIDIPSYNNVDLRAGISLQDGWQLSAYARNVFDVKGVTFASNNGGSLPQPLVTFVQPRTIGFIVSGSF